MYQRIPILSAVLFAAISLSALPTNAGAAAIGNAVWLDPDAPRLIKVRPPHYPHMGRHPGPRPHPGYHPGPRPGPRPGWARPGNYWWPRGGAVAAGAAIGFVTAATAAAWAGSPPSSGMCWYYTNKSRTQGYWDYCP